LHALLTIIIAVLFYSCFKDKSMESVEKSPTDQVNTVYFQFNKGAVRDFFIPFASESGDMEYQFKLSSLTINLIGKWKSFYFSHWH
jgi:hypothetical protein